MALKECPGSKHHLEECLRSLPPSLDKTYERILRNINGSSTEVAARILTLLCFSSRPLTVQELIDGIAIHLQEPARLDPDRRLDDIDDIRAICPGLIDTSFEENWKLFSDGFGEYSMDETTLTLRIAHFSVQEYLQSDRVTLPRFSLKSASAHAEIAQICFVYLQELELFSGKLDEWEPQDYPFIYYAAHFWHYHYKNVTKTVPQLDRRILELFRQPEDTFDTLMRLQNPERMNYPERSYLMASPIYHASFLGLDGVLGELIGHCQTHASEAKDLINAHEGAHGHALIAASYEGHEKVVQMLLDAGANVNAQGDYYGDALQTASLLGHEKIVQILIKAGANINAQGRSWGNALVGASKEGHEKVVQMLVTAGADVNIPDKGWGDALQPAAMEGFEKVVRILIDAGANVNARGGICGSALEAASDKGYEKIVQMLVDAGADVGAHEKGYAGALQQAARVGHEKVVQILVDAGADLDAQGSYGDALQEASHKGHEKVVQILIEAGANVNAQGGRYRTALQAASTEGHEKVVQILIDAGADIHDPGGRWGNALETALVEGHEKVIQVLINAGGVKRRGY